MAQKANLLRAPIVLKALRSGIPCTLQDGGSLLLIVTGKNQGKWVYQGRRKGSRNVMRYLCGYAPEIGLSEARIKRDEYRLLLKQGITPNQQNTQEEEESKRPDAPPQNSFRLVAKEYFATRQDMTAKTLGNDEYRIFNHAAPILDLPIPDIRRSEHLKPLIDALLEKKHYDQAKRVAGLLARIFRHALNCGYIEVTPAERLASLIPRQVGERKHHPAQTTVKGCQKLFSKIWTYADSHRSGPSVVAAIKIVCYIPIRCSNLIRNRPKIT